MTIIRSEHRTSIKSVYFECCVKKNQFAVQCNIYLIMFKIRYAEYCGSINFFMVVFYV